MTSLIAVSFLKTSWLPAPRVLFVLLAFAAIGCAGPPSDPRSLGRTSSHNAEISWTAVSMPLYFHYFDGPSQTQPPANGPYTFYFPNPASGAPIADQLGCTWQEYAPPYFFSNGAPLPRTIIERESPAVGTVFLTGSGSAEAIRGVGFLGQFTPGITSGQSNNIASVFYSTNDCYAGTLEYGFEYNYSANAAIFYFENNANCPPGSCFADEQGKVPVTDCSGGFALPVLPMSKGSQADGRNSHGTYEWNYRAFVVPEPPFYRMRVEALDPYTGEDGLSSERGERGEQCIVVPNHWDSNNSLAPAVLFSVEVLQFTGNSATSLQISYDTSPTTNGAATLRKTGARTARKALTSRHAFPPLAGKPPLLPRPTCARNVRRAVSAGLAFSFTDPESEVDGLHADDGIDARIVVRAKVE